MRTLAAFSLCVAALLAGCAVQLAGHYGTGEDGVGHGAVSLRALALKGRALGPVVGLGVAVSERGSIQNGSVLVGALQRPLRQWGFGYEATLRGSFGAPLFRDVAGTGFGAGLSFAGFFRLFGPTRRRALRVAVFGLDLVLGVEGDAWVPERDARAPGCTGCPLLEWSAHAGLRVNLLSDLVAEPAEADPRGEDGID